MWVAALHAAQVLMAHGLASGWLEWGGKRWVAAGAVYLYGIPHSQRTARARTARCGRWRRNTAPSPPERGGGACAGFLARTFQNSSCRWRRTRLAG